ncbi:hypothetical protein PROVRETT_09409 [Providencia rettgeri DSM 1131]|nr:hypothetical protein PROVRETT_09409 [Providencia rettgeri DSM 1131]
MKLLNSKFNSLQPDLPLLKLSFHYFLLANLLAIFLVFQYLFFSLLCKPAIKNPRSLVGKYIFI